MKTDIIATIITIALIIAALVKSLSDYTEGYITMGLVMAGIVVFYTVIMRKGIHQCRKAICISAVFGAILNFFLSMNIVNNSMKNDGTYYIATQCTSKAVSSSRKGGTYILNFNYYIFKNGKKGNKSLVVKKSEYDKVNVNSYYMIAEPAILDHQEKIWNHNPSEDDIQNFKNGVFVDANGKASEELRHQYLSNIQDNILTSNPILSFLLMLAIAVCSRFVIGIPPAVAYLCTIALIFYLNYGNVDIVVYILLIMTASSSLIGEKLYLKMIKRKLEKFGGYVTTGDYDSLTMSFRGNDYWVENVKLRHGKQRDFIVAGDIADIDRERRVYLGKVIVAVPRGLDHTPLVLANYDENDPEIERFKKGFFMKPGPIPTDFHDIEEDSR